MQYGRLKITFSTHFAKASKMKLHAMSIDETKCKERPAITILCYTHVDKNNRDVFGAGGYYLHNSVLR